VALGQLGQGGTGPLQAQHRGETENEASRQTASARKSGHAVAVPVVRTGWGQRIVTPPMAKMIAPTQIQLTSGLR